VAARSEGGGVQVDDGSMTMTKSLRKRDDNGTLQRWGHGGGILRGRGRGSGVLRGRDRGWQVVAAAQQFLGRQQSKREREVKNLLSVGRERANAEISRVLIGDVHI
jgi:hypothetical protein